MAASSYHLSIEARAVVRGRAVGIALVSSEPLSFWGGYDSKTGEILDRRHPLSGERAAGKVLALPVWSRNGKELFYRPGGQIWVASYAVLGHSFRAEKPRAWSPGRVPAGPGFLAWFDPHPDGNRFAVVKAAGETEARRDQVTLIQNFFDELRRIAPPAKR